jgi:ATP-binding cassette subfamily B protein AbcA/BmrA
VNNGSLTLTDLAAFQSYVLVAYQSFSSVPSLYTSFMYYNGSLFYIAGLMAEKEEVYRRERSMDLENQDIRFENVSFAYGETPVLQNASFTIPKGKVTVIVGPNGSGKTTLFKLVERFYTPDSGTMYFGSYDAETLHLDEWRRKIAYVLQDAQLFNGTIRENICYGINREVSDEEVEAAAKLACADGFIRELSGGYDFMIGENGNRLSGGQRQRIAIARAVMLDPGYLLLDEATCSMDVYSEQIVTDALFRLMEGRTTVLISHDMKILERADYIVVVNQGSIEAEGTVEAVKKSSPMLQSLLTANR